MLLNNKDNMEKGNEIGQKAVNRRTVTRRCRCTGATGWQNVLLVQGFLPQHILINPTDEGAGRWYQLLEKP